MRFFITPFDVDNQDKNASINLFQLLAIKPYPMPLWNAGNEFNRGSHSVTAEIRKGRPKSVVGPENINSVEKMIMKDRHVTYYCGQKLRCIFNLNFAG